MSGRSLFIKIYLCFLLATVLVMATQLLLDRMTDSGPFGERKERPPEAVLTAYGQSAVEKYISNDMKDMLEAAGQFRKDSGIEAFILDREGREIGNLMVPPHAVSLAERVRQSGTPQESSGPPPHLRALPIKGSDNKLYVVIGEMRSQGFGPPPQHGGPHHPGQFGPEDSSFLALRLLILLLVSGLVCYIFARYLTSPIFSLREATRSFASGNLKARVGKNMSGRRDEIADLANDFDMMAERIESLMNMQRQLLGDISHELRTPLTRLNLALELARNDVGPGAVKALNRVEQESECLNELIGKLLSFARMELNGEDKRTTSFDITGLIHGVVADADFEAQQSGRSVKFSGDVKHVIAGNQELLRRAIENVVRNAIRYTPENSAVLIDTRITADKSHLEISVRDGGPGVPKAELANIFHPFYRISNARERKTGGVGLGLAITERAVRLHGGAVTACNNPEGGLTVTISLPLGPAS